MSHNKSTKNRSGSSEAKELIKGEEVQLQLDMVDSEEENEMYAVLDYDFLEEDEKEPEEMPPLAHFLYKSTEPGDRILREWIGTILPSLIEQLSDVNAKGMSHRKALTLLNIESQKDVDKTLQARIDKLVHLADQSLLTHILNGTMATWVIVKLCNLSEEEQRLFLVGYALHDLNKMEGQDLRLDSENSEDYVTALEKWAEKLNIWQFLDRSYQYDVAFLAQNAEAKRGENRTLANYKELKTSSDLLEDLSEFVRLADLLATPALVSRPEDLLTAKSRKILDLLRRLLQGRYRVAYHKTSENRGRLTQIIHNHVIQEAIKAKWKPFLFFAEGVTYLVPQEGKEPVIDNLAQSIRQELLDKLKGQAGSLISRAGIGFKFPTSFVELLPPELAGQVMSSRVMQVISEKKTPVTEQRKEKMVLAQDSGLVLDLNFPASLIADRLAEGCFALSKLLAHYYTGKSNNYQIYGEKLVRALEMEKHLPYWKAIPYTGGVGYPWFYVAGHYAKKNPGLSPEQTEEILNKAYKDVLEECGVPETKPPFAFLEPYLSNVLTVESGKVVDQKNQWDFENELELYTKNKALRSGKRVCAICNSPFSNVEEFSIFTNKKIVGWKVPSGRGICDLCQTENLLRRTGMNSTIKEQDDAVFLHLYPAYFFTPITARAISQIYNKLHNVTFSELRKPYEQSHGQLKKLCNHDIFKLTKPEDNRSIKKIAYSMGERHGYHMVGIPYMGRDPTDTERWSMPVLLALFTPVLLGVKVYASRSPIPVYRSGTEFRETVLLDSPHSFWQHGMAKSVFRLDELSLAFDGAMALYEITSDAYRDSRNFPVWNQLNSICRAVESDPLIIFYYADRIATNQRGGGNVTTTRGMNTTMAERLLKAYERITTYYEEILRWEGKIKWP
ncbi:type I-D CRISPR-associated protein Cas10d/Csc3 [Heliorestis convoluta]|uniref:Type I-D CRISPR-associated protein Cas10d/Csc3 n=1 Tax=Heliorestis convoluta TaxID=356322 RepID=A0A5Q2N0X0_9FIRM|nr:type I-D CRISPR-associated protein Cas10d/Csc3 [Heliorestis convoluta]QGG48994.1 type I-D CRISPR-associated protein Cas10d/Csc3 [Heliorestis convoluta]